MGNQGNAPATGRYNPNVKSKRTIRRVGRSRRRMSHPTSHALSSESTRGLPGRGMDPYFQGPSVGLIERKSCSDLTKGDDSIATGCPTVSTANWSNSTSSRTERNVFQKFLDRHGSDFGDDEKDQEPTLRDAFSVCLSLMGTEACHFLRTFFSEPLIIVLFLLTFVVVCASGVVAVQILCENRRDEKVHEATYEAMDNGKWFADEFARVLLPLFSLRQAVMHSPYFKHLSAAIGEAGEPGSAPWLPNKKNYRNVTGICDDSELQQRFHDVVEAIRHDSGLKEEEEGIVVSYRLAPHAVMCYMDPLVNRRDFLTETIARTDGKSVVFNSSAHMGWDVAHEYTERWYQTVRETIGDPSNPIDIYGPHEFVRNGVNIIPTLYCGHLSVNMPGYNIRLDGKNYESWGFVMVFIHFERLIKKSAIHKKFAKRGMEFKMIRRDSLQDPLTGKKYEKVVVIAESEKSNILNEDNSIEIPFNTPNGVWINKVGYESGFVPAWKVPVLVVVVVASFVFASMFATVLIQRHHHKKLLYKMMPKRVVWKLNKGMTVVEKYDLVTIFFSDIVGFTSMAGEMSPIQVMAMLNDLYIEFDKLVEKHKIYKVETIGDAYMVMGGAPERCTGPEAAEKVALFALDAIDLVKTFQTQDGSTIKVRAGIHSGPVVAGVVGKTMPRYCLFGDTVNFASRMESTSKKMKIQCSDMTYRLLRDAPSHCFDLVERIEDGQKSIEVKGKGMIHTWWIKGSSIRPYDINLDESASASDMSDIEVGDEQKRRGILSFPKRGKLRFSLKSNDAVEAMQESFEDDFCDLDEHLDSSLFLSLTKQPWASIGRSENHMIASTSCSDVMVDQTATILEGRLQMVLVERGDTLSDKAKVQLRNYVGSIAANYNHVKYHSFEHATHVVISINKLIDIMIARSNSGAPTNSLAHDTFSHFCLVFSALIHDVEHTGMSNQILSRFIPEGVSREEHNQTLTPMLQWSHDDEHLSRMAKYENSLAERNSLHCAFDALYQDDYQEIRECIIPTKQYRVDFVKILFDTVLCTDIANKNRTDRIKERFCVAFEEAGSSLPSLCEGSREEMLRALRFDSDCSMNLDTTTERFKTSVVHEHMIQVADVAHTMQGWENFIKWNYRLYKELMDCFASGLMPDPTVNWYKGQISFFDNYVIPLALRTSKCNVLGHNGSELVALAELNKKRWMVHGEQIAMLMACGVKNNEDDKSVLSKCFLAHHCEQC